MCSNCLSKNLYLPYFISNLSTTTKKNRKPLQRGCTGNKCAICCNHANFHTITTLREINFSYIHKLSAECWLTLPTMVVVLRLVLTSDASITTYASAGQFN